MNLTAQLTSLRRQTEGLSLDDQARACCEVAKQMEKAGEYEMAAEALQDFWPDMNEEPHVGGLEPATRATVLLRAGSVLGASGSAGQTAGSQERAKNLIT